MGKLVLAKDWSCTPLGPIESWPQSLRTTVSLCLASNFPISIAWGAQHTQIYNDGYWPICGAKHPASLGQDFSVCWASAWPVIGASFERALRGRRPFSRTSACSWTATATWKRRSSRSLSAPSATSRAAWAACSTR